MVSQIFKIILAFTLTAAFVVCKPTPAFAQGVPDLSRFDFETRQSIELACIMQKSQGPVAYGNCLNEQLNALRNSPGIPSLSGVDTETRQSIELACIMQKSQGPVAYGSCLNEQLNALRNSPGIPSLSSVDTETRQSIELACIMQKSEGPVAYGSCLRSQLHSIGIQPGVATRVPSTDPSQARPRTPPLSPPARLAQPAIPSRDARVRPTLRSFSSPLGWDGVEKPSMPSTLRTGKFSPETVFSSVEKSIYVLISAPSEHSLHTKSNVSQGSAVAVTQRIALTNCHVLEGNNLHFLVKDKMVLPAKIAYGHKDSDRCAVAVESGSLTPITGVRPYSTLTIGEKVYTIGSPSGLENTLGEGIVSGLRRRTDIELVQMSAPISPGSSGGGLFDAAGNLIGITTFLLRDSQNLNFAIAADAFWK